jgi:hypothetical protein
MSYDGVTEKRIQRICGAVRPSLGQILRIEGDKKGSEELFSTAARLKSEKEAQLSNMLEQGIQ